MQWEKESYRTPEHNPLVLKVMTKGKEIVQVQITHPKDL